MSTPYKHQQEAFDFIKRKDSFALFMDMGTGKSKVILMKLLHLIEKNEIDKTLIIVPNYLKYSWISDHFEPHFEKPYDSYIYTGNIISQKEKTRFNNFCISGKFKVFVINVEAFQSSTVDVWVKEFFKITKKCMIVIDESTIIKNPKAKRTVKILNGFKNFQYKAILSGTPSPASPSDLYSQFDFLKTLFFNCNYFQFKHKYTIFTQQKTQNHVRYDAILTEKDYNIIKNALKKNTITAEYLNELSIKYNVSESNIIRINKMFSYSPYKDLDKLNEQISTITFKVMKKDCLDLPDKIYEKIIVELNPEQIRMYKELTKDFFTSYDESQLTVVNTITLLCRLKQITGGIFPFIDINFDSNDITEIDSIINRKMSIKRIDNNPKIKAIIEDIENSQADTSIVIWSNFVECIKYLYDEISFHKYTCATYYGETNDREFIIEQFKNKQIKILIANPMTAGMGLNLQVSCLHYFYDNSYRADLRTQAEDRSHRIGQTNKVVYKDVIAKNTIDEKIYQLVQNKINLLNYFKDKNNIKEVINLVKNF
jgi:SNF2 family DNA or RNA helicase